MFFWLRCQTFGRLRLWWLQLRDWYRWRFCGAQRIKIKMEFGAVRLTDEGVVEVTVID